jgi:hypothetical protein
MIPAVCRGFLSTRLVLFAEFELGGGASRHFVPVDHAKAFLALFRAVLWWPEAVEDGQADANLRLLATENLDGMGPA